MELIKVNINSVYDADTFRATVVGSGRFNEILTNVPFRIMGVNAPERRGGTILSKLLEKKGRDRLIALLEVAKQVQIDLDGEMSFGRFHTDLFIDGLSWSELMIKEKLAIAYNGEYSVKDFDWDGFVKEKHPELLLSIK